MGPRVSAYEGLGFVLAEFAGDAFGQWGGGGESDLLPADVAGGVFGRLERVQGADVGLVYAGRDRLVSFGDFGAGLLPLEFVEAQGLCVSADRVPGQAGCGPLGAGRSGGPRRGLGTPACCGTDALCRRVRSGSDPRR